MQRLREFNISLLGSSKKNIIVREVVVAYVS